MCMKNFRQDFPIAIFLNQQKHILISNTVPISRNKILPGHISKQARKNGRFENCRWNKKIPINMDKILFYPNLSAGTIVVWYRSHKSVHMDLTFFNNQTVISIRRNVCNKRSCICTGGQQHRQTNNNKFFHFSPL